MDDYNAWSEARDKHFQELGMARLTLYEVHSRTMNMVCVVSPGVTPEELQQWQAKYGPDEVIRKLARERREKKVLFDGTTEFFRLTDAQATRLLATGPEAKCQRITCGTLLIPYRRWRIKPWGPPILTSS